jgi:hypothetical protein
MKNNGKNNFYRLLNLDKESKIALKWFREHVKSIMNDSEKKQSPLKEDKSND